MPFTQTVNITPMAKKYGVVLKSAKDKNENAKKANRDTGDKVERENDWSGYAKRLYDEKTPDQYGGIRM